MCAAPLAAAQRDLHVPPYKGWGHAATGLAFPARLDGLARTKIADSTTDERDVSLNYEDSERARVITVFVFHPALVNVPVWFDRAEAQIALRDVWHGATPASAAPISFARPGSSIAGGLRQVYRTGNKEYPATVLAIVPVGAWLVAIRYSARDLDPQQLQRELDGVLNAIRWPAESAVLPPIAVPIVACAVPLQFGKAKMQKREVETGLLGGVLSGLMMKPPADAKPQPAKLLCRDGNPTVEYGVYRSEGFDGYTLAFGDAGRVAYVSKGLDIPGLKGAGGYTVTFGNVDGSMATYQSFDRMPAPGQVLEEIGKTNPISRTTLDAAGGTQVTIGVPK